MDSLREQYLEKAGMDVDLAGVEFAYDLAVGDPKTFKAGYSPRNAALAANELFGVDVERTAEAVAIRLARLQDA
jgi:hypothetical protein